MVNSSMNVAMRGARNEPRQTNGCISSLLSGTTTMMLNGTHNMVLITTRAVHKAEIYESYGYV